jgi:hypothetical protein
MNTMEDLGVVFDLMVDQRVEVEERETVESHVFIVNIDMMETSCMGENLRHGSSNEENPRVHDDSTTEEMSRSSSPCPHAEGISNEAGGCKDLSSVNREGDIGGGDTGIEIKQQSPPPENHVCFLKRQRPKMLRIRRVSWNQHCSGANSPGSSSALRRGILWKKNLHVET